MKLSETIVVFACVVVAAPGLMGITLFPRLVTKLTLIVWII